MDLTTDPFWIWFVGIALFGGIVWTYFLLRNKRKNQFYRMAEDIGFQCSANIHSLPVDYPCDRRDFPLGDYGSLFGPNIPRPVLYGRVNNAHLLIFDYVYSVEEQLEKKQTVACFRIDRELLWARAHPDSVEGWTLRYGAHGWFCLYKPGLTVKPGQMCEFLNEATRIGLPRSSEETVPTAKPHKERFIELPTSELDARLAQAELVRQMIALLQGFEDTPEYRARMVRWTRAIWPREEQGGSPFPRNGNAISVFSSICQAHKQYDDGTYIVRATDVAGYLSWFKRCFCRIHHRPLAVLSLSIPEVSRIVETPIVRYWVDGLAWMEGMEFPSPLSGRCYTFEAADHVCANTALTQATVYSEDGDPADLIAELFECLALDDADTTYLTVSIPPRWKLLRLDDNGHQLEISRFSGLSKARKKLAEFEKQAHKQTYWLETSNGEAVQTDQG